ncbi:tyrosine-type recombinase/integrase [Oceanobacter mangrovi]|uniref:tyrosine-type recombinase/integrase n=1 Tax=Oceanobacter mangrovi TaxID=2862510 RepID=UPI001C8E91A7|nr:tyrosine-type recombinase/integrase [Oceanobacter mangrovi]
MSDTDNAGYEGLMKTLWDQLLRDNQDIPADRQEYKQERYKMGEVKRMITESALNQKGEIDGYHRRIDDIIKSFIEIVWPEADFSPIYNNPEECRRFLDDMRSMIYHVSDQRQEMLNPETNIPPLPSYLGGGLQNKPLPEDKIEPLKIEGVCFSKLHKEYIDHLREKGTKESTLEDYERYNKRFVNMRGDSDVNGINKVFLRSFIYDFKKLPRMNLNRYKGVAETELLKINIPDSDLVSPRYVHSCVKWLVSVFNFAVESEYLNKNPADGLTRVFPKGGTRYSDYTDEEVRTLIRKVSGNSFKWRELLVMLGAYTGMRLGEIHQLRKEDFRRDTHSGVMYISVNKEGGKKVKNDNSLRSVPIHQKLVDYGLMEYVDQLSAGERLFTNREQYCTQWFAGFLSDCGIDKLNQLGERRVFHSFRHTCVTKMKSKNIGDSLVEQVVGHKEQRPTITDGYTHRFPIEDLVPAVNAIDYGME